MKKVISIIICLALIIAALPLSALNVSANTSGYYIYGVTDGKATISDVYTSISGDITIPSTLGGYPVTSIGEYAFWNCSSLTSITIPDSVTSIRSGAFSECKSLEAITIPDSVTSIVSFAFSGCSSLKAITVPDSVTSIGQNAFEDCDSLTSITIPDSVTSIGSWAFEDCDSLTSITIPDSVTRIGNDAFSNCVSLKAITIPDSVTSIGYDAFYNTAWYNNQPDGLIYGGKVAYKYKGTCPATVVIKDGTLVITGSAFYDCDSLKTITFPDSVTSIGDRAFYDCNNLTSVTIPDSVTSIGNNAFYYCSSLKEVFYRGSSEDKTKITIGSNNSRLTNATWYYNSCIGVAEHTYDNTCDTVCNVCEFVRTIQHTYDNNCDTTCNVCKFERSVPDHVYDNACDTNCNECQLERSVPDHNYTLNGNHTCESCGISITPNAPTIESKTNSSVTLVKTDGLEYSKDGTAWQDSNVFTNLSKDTTYTFYQRVKATYTTKVSEISEGTSVTFKSAQAAPSAPIVSSFTDTTVTLIPIANGEYSVDGKVWQTSNVFIGLNPATVYTVYQRYAETDTHEASDSKTFSLTTDKSKQTLIPDAPTVQSVTTNSITLNIVNGCEYSKDGRTWQSSNVFSGLSCGTQYSFYQRYKETTTTYVGKSSTALTAKTDKGTQTAPSAPTLISKTHNTVTLKMLSGYEYSRDGINWQTSNVFTGLTAETNYFFFCRKAETDTYYASALSSSLIVRTEEAPLYTLGDLDGDGNLTATDLAVMKLFLAGISELDGTGLLAGDLNEDGKVDATDLAIIKLKLAGLA